MLRLEETDVSPANYLFLLNELLLILESDSFSELAPHKGRASHFGTDPEVLYLSRAERLAVGHIKYNWQSMNQMQILQNNKSVLRVKEVGNS